jgi:hypothetical protein
MSPENLSRRATLAGAASVPALALPAFASTATATATAASACTLPPDLIERFVRVRAWYLGSRQAEILWSDEIDRRFYAATGFAWDDVNRRHPRFEELEAAREKIYAEVPAPCELDETESNLLADERWRVAEAIIDHKPQTVVDLAW